MSLVYHIVRYQKLLKVFILLKKQKHIFYLQFEYRKNSFNEFCFIIVWKHFFLFGDCFLFLDIIFRLLSNIAKKHIYHIIVLFRIKIIF